MLDGGEEPDEPAGGDAVTREQKRILLSATGKEFFGEQEDFDAMLDEVEAASGLARSRPRPSPRLQWATYVCALDVGKERTSWRLEAYRQFRPKYFLISTSGFVVNSLDLNRAYRLLDEVDGDLYLVSEWDRLERESQLERVRLPGFTMKPRDQLHLQVTLRNAANLAPGRTVRFSAMIVGEELVEGPY